MKLVSLRCGWLVIDVRDGGVDGYYSSLAVARKMRSYWIRELGHDDVIIAKASSARPIGKCFMESRRLESRQLSSQQLESKQRENLRELPLRPRSRATPGYD